MRSAEEVDAVMGAIHPVHRRWCVAGCGARPGHPEDMLVVCACSGCLGAHGADISWEEFCAWEERHKDDPPERPYLLSKIVEDKPPTLAERLAAFKERKRISS